MIKEKYERTELEIINFMTGVVLITMYSEAKGDEGAVRISRLQRGSLLHKRRDRRVALGRRRNKAGVSAQAAQRYAQVLRQRWIR